MAFPNSRRHGDHHGQSFRQDQSTSGGVPARTVAKRAHRNAAAWVPRRPT